MDVLFLVLDAIVRIIGTLVLLGGFVLLIVFVWDTIQSDDEDDAFIPVVTDRQRMSLAMAEGMGFITRHDFARYGADRNTRLGHCYMLVGKAVLWSRNDSIPSPAAVIHGSWHGPDAPKRIDHAIILLDNGKIWEPITAGIYDRAKFESYTRWKRHQIYSVAETRTMMELTGHYGPWQRG